MSPHKFGAPPMMHFSRRDGSAHLSAGMRDSYDAQRRAAESFRTQQESQRRIAENFRAQQESQRRAAESFRVQQETQRRWRETNERMRDRSGFFTDGRAAATHTPRPVGAPGTHSGAPTFLFKAIVLGVLCVYAVPHFVHPAPAPILAARNLISAAVMTAAREWATPDVAGAVYRVVEAVSR